MRDAELTALKRAATHAFTTLDVCRRKWAVLSSEGKTALSNCINANLRLAHSEGGDWPAGFGLVRGGVLQRALQERQKAEEAVPPVLLALEVVVADMRAASEALKIRADAVVSAQHLEPTTPLMHGESVERTVARVADLARTFERELEMRQCIAAELAGSGAAKGGDNSGEAADVPGWDANAQILLAAWVMEPHVDGEHLDLLFEAVAAEPGTTRGR